MSNSEETIKDLWSALKTVNDPDLGMSIVDLGLIYEVKLDGKKADVDMTLTSPACPYGPQMVGEAKAACEKLLAVDEANVELVWDPPWSLENLSDEVKLDMGIDW